MHLTTLHFQSLPFQLLHRILRTHPGAACAAPAGSRCDCHLQPQRISLLHRITECLLPGFGEIRALERRRLGHIHSPGIELVETGDAHGIHPFKVFLDAVKAHLAIHPVPPNVGPGGFGRILELLNQFVIAIRRSRQHGQKHGKDHLHILQI